MTQSGRHARKPVTGYAVGPDITTEQRCEMEAPGMSFCRGSVNCHGSDGQMYHFCESSRSGEILLDQYRGGGG